MGVKIAFCWCQQDGCGVFVGCLEKWGKMFKRCFFIYFNIFFLRFVGFFLSFECRLRFRGGFGGFWLKV